MNNETAQPTESPSLIIERDYELWEIEVKKSPLIKRILEMIELDKLFLDQLKVNICMLEIGSNQNQLRQIIELLKLDVNLLKYEPVLVQSVSNLNLQDQELDLHLAYSQGAQVNIQNDSSQMLKKICDLVGKAKANVGQVTFNQYLIEVQKLIRQYQEDFNAEHQLTQVVEHIDTLLQVRLRPASAQPNLNLVKQNLERMNQSLNAYFEINRNRNILIGNLIRMNTNLITMILQVDCMPSMLQDYANWDEMNSNAAKIIQEYCSPRAKFYIDTDDSFKDIWDQLAAMYTVEEQQTGKRRDKNYTWCGSFYNAIVSGKLEEVENFLERCPLALTAQITADRNTALHVAVKVGKQKIVTKLLEKLKKEHKDKETLKMKNKEGKTALYIAASCGFTDIAQQLVEMNKETLLIECEAKPFLPLFVAAKYNNNKIVKYLYDEMQEYKREANDDLYKYPIVLDSSSNDADQNVAKRRQWLGQWVSFLANLIYNDDYNMASNVVQDYQRLALTSYTDVEAPLFVLAQRPSLGANKTVRDEALKRKYIYAPKAKMLLEQIILTIDDWKSQKSVLSAALFKAAEVGSVDFVAMIINFLPLMVSWLNDDYQNIFHVAVINRQEKVFNLIHGLGPVKNDLIGSADKSNNWMLHLAGNLAPLYRLDEVPSAALQLQHELQWFEAVKEIVPNNSIDVQNLKNETPRELFTSTHIELMKDAKDWIRSITSSYSIVATLIATVMFAGVFTVPGGNDQKGYPILVQQSSFLYFTISHGIALFTSCISVFMFLAILTARFTLQDYLKSLPERLIIGLILLFISMVAMMVAFGIAIYISIQEQYRWFYFPIIGVGVVPIFLYLFMHFGLLKDLLWYTYIHIFRKRAENLL